ncbi:hypothetical protein LLEC1_03445, partial [Akanthomyces lecanii]
RAPLCRVRLSLPHAHACVCALLSSRCETLGCANRQQRALPPSLAPVDRTWTKHHQASCLRCSLFPSAHRLLRPITAATPLRPLLASYKSLSAPPGDKYTSWCAARL